jgi:hypothetical protein
MSPTGVPLLNGENGHEDLIYQFLFQQYFLDESIKSLRAQTKTLRGDYPEVTDRDKLTQVLAILDGMWNFQSNSTPLMTNLRDISVFTDASARRFDVETIFRAYQVATGREKVPLTDGPFKKLSEAMCAVVVSQTSCNDRNHPILRGVIAPHQDFFFLQKS